MAGLEEAMLPYSRPWRRQSAAPEQAADLDEERRLCYVGMTRAKHRLVLSLARRRMGFGESGPSFRDTQPSRFLGDLSPELFGLPAHQIRPAAVGPVVRRHPGSLPDEPFIELDDVVPDFDDPAPAQARQGQGRADLEPTVDYSFDQRSEAGTAFTRGDQVVHGAFGEGLVRSCDAPGPQAKVTVAFFSVGEKRVLARFLRRA
jgi:DNA helicase-2/ATP-dependent DNA helicase PcrA